MIQKILIVGHGSIGKRHLRIARALFPNADIRILRHLKTDNEIENKNDYFWDIEEALAFSPQIAVIANPAPFHVSIAKQLAQIGAHLLIEKPLSDSLDGIQELIKICEENQVVLMVGYNLRYSPSLKKLKMYLLEGKVGKVLSVHSEVGQYLPSWRSDVDYRKTVSSQKKLGGGVLLELSHELDYLRWLFGEVNWIYADLEKRSELELDVEDSANLILGFKNISATIKTDFFRRDTTRKCTVIGEKGTLFWDALLGSIQIYESDSEKWHTIFSHSSQKDETYISEWENFIACIEGKTKPSVTGQDGFSVMKIIAAARESYRLGKCQKINKKML